MKALLVSASFLLFGPVCFGQCPNRCSVNGVCNNLGTCECASGFTGGDCSVRSCPSGSAFSDVAQTADTAHQDTICSGRGSCVDGNCACNDGFTGVACERTQCKNDCSHRGRCVSMHQLVETTRNHESQQYSYDQWDADKIYGCICDLGYTGYDCSLRVCPSGFSGGDCSLRTCKKGLAWFGYPSANDVAHDEEVECSSSGNCHRTVGECSCNDGFFGAACEYMGCAGEDPEQSCSGHGTCLSMRELGLLHTNADTSPSPITYGSDPNGAATWDADRIFGCSCDVGFEGYDCSLRTCPQGIEPSTSESHTCSRKGVCNHQTGKCKCFAGWGSSDGSGSLGPNNDCGHRLKLRGYP
ncbi:hypothetical protein ACHAXR_011191 [Thalassiosira sp. AJA248-18]